MRISSVLLSTLSVLAVSAAGVSSLAIESIPFGLGPVPSELKAAQADTDEGVVISQLVTQSPTVLVKPTDIDQPKEDTDALITNAVLSNSSLATSHSAVQGASPTASGEEIVLTSGHEIAEIGTGDTVYALARKYGVQPNTIIMVNNLQPPFTLRVGDKIAIPGADNAQVVTSRPAIVTAQPVAGQFDIVQQTPNERTPPVQVAQTYIPSSPATHSAVVQPVSQPYAGSAKTTRAQKIHEVRAGETLYSIARTHGLTVSQLAVANNVGAPYALSIGQRLILPGHTVVESHNTPALQSRNTYISPAIGTQDGVQTTPETVAYQRPEASRPPLGVSRFGWPIRGEVVMGFGRDDNGRQNDGINIAAPIGTPIKSVADGEVVYRGADLDGYGNLLLIKHADRWVSAYAHTDTMLVQKGDKVRRGQTIAKVGDTGSVGQPQLHFELRHDLQPTDPLAALEGRDAKALAP